MLSINGRFSSSHPSESDDSSILLSPRKVAQFLLTVVAVLVVCSIIVTILMYELPDFPLQGFLFYKFSVNQEQNIPTLYSSLALALSSALIFVIARFKAQIGARFVNHWRFLSLTFLYLAVDELTEMHEAASKPMHNLGINGFFHNAWLIPASVVLIIFGFSFLGFLMHLPKLIRYLFMFSCCVFLSGAFLTELLSGYYAFLYGRENIGYVLFTTVEETLEMLGIVAFIYSLLTYIQQLGIRQLEMRVRISGAK